MTLAGKLAAIGQRDDDLVGVVDHMVVGDDNAGGVDDEARSSAGHLLPAIAEAPAELAAQRRVAQFRRQFAEHIAARDGFGDRDVHHGRQHLLDQRRQAFRRGSGASRLRRAGCGQKREAQNQMLGEPLHYQRHQPDRRWGGWHDKDRFSNKSTQINSQMARDQGCNKTPGRGGSSALTNRQVRLVPNEGANNRTTAVPAGAGYNNDIVTLATSAQKSGG